MTFEMKKTGRHLRTKALQEGDKERMRALQALSYGYGKGSHAALARLLLATLGGSAPLQQDQMTPTEAVCTHPTVAKTIGTIAQPMQDSANDRYYQSKEASTAGSR